MVGIRQTLRHHLYGLAAGQSGYFTAAQALDLGFSYQAQKYHVDHENWRRVERGIFRLPEWPIGRHDSMILRVLWSKGRAVISHDSAAAAYNIGDANPNKTHLTVDAAFRKSHPSVVLHIAMLHPSDVTSFEGVTITTALRTVLDIACTHYDEEFVIGTLVDAIDHAGVRPRQIEARLHELPDVAQTVLRRGLNATAPAR